MSTRAPGAPYTFGGQLSRDAEVAPYASTADLPDGWRMLWVFALDPSLPKHEGETQCIRVPHEPLAPGPVGGLFEVDMEVPASGTCYRRVDLDDPALLRNDGVFPDEADARFHGQMVYAIASLTYETFRKALGRQPGWAFPPRVPGQPSRLVLAPFAMEDANAYYDRQQGRICFGYAHTPEGLDHIPPDKAVFTALSSDIITHEVTHAILDGLRPYFTEPTGPDVPAFHEAFADLMAIFQRFHFEDFVRAQIRRNKGDISITTLLNVIAPEIGYVTEKQMGVRSFVVRHGRDAILGAQTDGRTESGEQLDARQVVTLEDVDDSPHRRGAVLAEAVFEAFATIASRRAAPLIRLRTGGRERLLEGELSPELLDQLSALTRKVARQFQTICIRAIDYCPPIDIDFGDYLRAMITADCVLVAEDPHGYREALVDAFRRRRIYPGSVRTMSEKSLVWNPPQRALPRIAGLSLDQLRFDGDPGGVPRKEDAEYHARVLGDMIAASRAMMSELGLCTPSDEPGREVEPFEIASLRSARRAGPDGQIAFDLIAEIAQRQSLRLADGRIAPHRGGATLILNAWGEIRYIVRKRGDETTRQDRFGHYLGRGGQRFWAGDDRVELASDVFQKLCLREVPDAEAGESLPVAARDVVGKTWVLVQSPPGVPDGHPLLLDDLLLLATGQPARVMPVSEHEYRLVRDDGVVFSRRRSAPVGRTQADPFLITLEEVPA